MGQKQNRKTREARRNNPDGLVKSKDMELGISYAVDHIDSDGTMWWRPAGAVLGKSIGHVYVVPENKIAKKIKHEVDKGARRSGGQKPMPRARRGHLIRPEKF
jgi:hypothetical protein